MSFFTPVAEPAPEKTYELIPTGYYVFKLIDLKSIEKQFGSDTVQQLEWDFALAPLSEPAKYLRKGDGTIRSFRQWTPIKEGVMLRVGTLAHEWISALLAKRLDIGETPDLDEILDQRMIAELFHAQNARDKSKYNEKIKLGSAQVYTKRRRVVEDEDEENEDAA